jgi:CheY-like chemotaxis protein/anti-sigma regulatory factor (Ser/Thr protein kinase)
VQIVAELAEVSVSPEIGALAEAAVSHLLHNTVMHGIEPRAVRTSLGKPPHGLVRLTSRLADGVITITVEDDGAGRDDRGEYFAELQRRLERSGGSLQTRSVAGRGASATMSLVDSALSVAVRTFRSSNDGLLLAVDTSWSLLHGWHRALPLDPVAALGLRLPDESATTHTAVFKRDDITYEIPVRSTPMLSAATRICPTSADAVVEVVAVGEQEALLLRLDRLAAPGAQSTVPPSLTATATPVEAFSPIATRRPERRVRTAHNVLLLDADPTWLVLTRAALLHRGFDVQAVTSLTALGEALESSPPHIILADVAKLAISAEELCRRVKQARPLLPVVLFADMGAAELARLAEGAEADGSLSKSVGPDELVRALEARLG